MVGEGGAECFGSLSVVFFTSNRISFFFGRKKFAKRHLSLFKRRSLIPLFT